MAENQLNTSDEIWKAIPGFEGHYDVSTHGRIRSYWQRVNKGKGNGHGSISALGNEPRILNPGKRNNYPAVELYGEDGTRKQIHMHTLILLTFIGPCPPGMQCCHNDGTRTNNFLDNLRWDTPKSNCEDRNIHGATSCGENHTNSKLTINDVRQIREMASQGVSHDKIKEFFSVCHQNISSIVLRKTWKHI